MYVNHACPQPRPAAASRAPGGAPSGPLEQPDTEARPCAAPGLDRWRWPGASRPLPSPGRRRALRRARSVWLRREACHVQHVLDQGQEVLPALVDARDALALPVGERPEDAVQEGRRIGLDGVEGRSELVARGSPACSPAPPRPGSVARARRAASRSVAHSRAPRRPGPRAPTPATRRPRNRAPHPLYHQDERARDAGREALSHQPLHNVLLLRIERRAGAEAALGIGQADRRHEGVETCPDPEPD